MNAIADTKRRVKRCLVTPEFIVHAGMNGRRHIETTSGLPEDTRCIAQYFDPERACIVLVCESESFPEIAEGDIIPLADPPQFRIIDNE